MLPVLAIGPKPVVGKEGEIEAPRTSPGVLPAPPELPPEEPVLEVEAPNTEPPPPPEPPLDPPPDTVPVMELPVPPPMVPLTLEPPLTEPPIEPLVVARSEDKLPLTSAALALTAKVNASKNIIPANIFKFFIKFILM